jgi:hypothetical protein
LYDDSPCPVPWEYYDTIKVSVSLVRGEKYGELVNPETGARGKLFTDIRLINQSTSLLFDADGDTLTSVDTIGIYVSTSDPKTHPVEQNFLIIPSPVLVTVVPPSISPGDTADITVKKRNPDGSIEDFPADQIFEIGTISGCINGEILTSVGKAPYFRDVPAPFKFVAAGSPDTMNTKVRIRVGVPPDEGGGGGIAGVIRSGGEQDSIRMKKRETVTKLIKVQARVSKQEKQKPAKAASLDVCNANEFVYDIFGVGDGDVEEIELVVIEPTENQLLQKEITAEPKMPPDMKVKAQLKNYDGEVNFFIMIPELKWQVPGTTIITTGYFDGESTGSGIVEIPFTFPKDYIRGGDDMELEVKAVANGKMYNKKVKKPYKVLGINPTKREMLAELQDLKYKVIALQESNFNQFAPGPNVECSLTPYFPLQGVNHVDIGIMQINRPTSDDLFWHWKKNIKRGKDILDYNIWFAGWYTGKQYPDASPLTEVQKLEMAYSLYNQWNWKEYWLWKQEDPEKGFLWKRNPPPAHTGHKKSYAEECIDKFNSHPSDW